MKTDTTLSARCLPRTLLTLACAALLTIAVGLSGCASPPPAPAPVVAAPTPTRAQRIEASLKAMNFEQREDGWHLSLPAPLIFQFDSDVVSPDARDNLIRVARELRALGIDTLLVRGHTDTVGTREYNMALSKRRADAVARVLAEGSYPVEGIDAKGLGSVAPIAENSSAEGRAKNRRVVIIVQVRPSSGALGGPTNEFVAVPARRYVWFA